MIKDVKTMLYVRTWEVDVKEEERREARGEKRRHQFEFWGMCSPFLYALSNTYAYILT